MKIPGPHETVPNAFTNLNLSRLSFQFFDTRRHLNTWLISRVRRTYHATSPTQRNANPTAVYTRLDHEESQTARVIGERGPRLLVPKRFAACRTGLRSGESPARTWLPSHRSWQIGLPLKRRGYLTAYGIYSVQCRWERWKVR